MSQKENMRMANTFSSYIWREAQFKFERKGNLTECFEDKILIVLIFKN